jgi:hypothetical protein
MMNKDQEEMSRSLTAASEAVERATLAFTEAVGAIHAMQASVRVLREQLQSRN